MKKKISTPDYDYERALEESHGRPICGVDEAGRGSWAGPVVAAAVILDPERIPNGLNDSKILSAQQRETLFCQILACSHIGIGVVGVESIDRDNILQASFRAMEEAVKQLSVFPAAAIIDGNGVPSLSCPAYPLIGGDRLSVSVAAASIAAKVTRDRIMIQLARDFSAYGWERNMGYGTRQHREGLETSGVTSHHRKSFAPIRKLLSRHYEH